jgi:hypothetical protein
VAAQGVVYFPKKAARWIIKKSVEGECQMEIAFGICIGNVYSIFFAYFSEFSAGKLQSERRRHIIIVYQPSFYYSYHSFFLAGLLVLHSGRDDDADDGVVEDEKEGKNSFSLLEIRHFFPFAIQCFPSRNWQKH